MISLTLVSAATNFSFPSTRRLDLGSSVFNPKTADCVQFIRSTGWLPPGAPLPPPSTPHPQQVCLIGGQSQRMHRSISPGRCRHRRLTLFKWISLLLRHQRSVLKLQFIIPGLVPFIRERRPANRVDWVANALFSVSPLGERFTLAGLARGVGINIFSAHINHKQLQPWFFSSAVMLWS